MIADHATQTGLCGYDTFAALYLQRGPHRPVVDDGLFRLSLSIEDVDDRRDDLRPALA